MVNLSHGPTNPTETFLVQHTTEEKSIHLHSLRTTKMYSHTFLTAGVGMRMKTRRCEGYVCVWVGGGGGEGGAIIGVEMIRGM